MLRRLMLPTLALLAACTGASGKEVRAPGSNATIVGTAPVTLDAVAPPVVATGTLRSKDEIALSFKIGGIVSQVNVDAGATVRAGATLASLELREIDAAVARAQSAADKAERDLARAKRLYADSVVTLAQLQDAETAASVARADLETARFNRQYAVIVAPAAGVILDRQKQPGELVAPGATVLVLGSAARGAVLRVGLADRDVVRVARGDPATVRFDALPGRELAGTVGEIAAAADPLTGTYRVEVRLPAGTGLASGLVGQVEIRPRAVRPVMMVPIEALVEADGSRGTVYVLKDGHAERREVTIAFLDGARVAVASGVTTGEQVITSGAAYLENGAAVVTRP